MSTTKIERLLGELAQEIVDREKSMPNVIRQLRYECVRRSVRDKRNKCAAMTAIGVAPSNYYSVYKKMLANRGA